MKFTGGRIAVFAKEKHLGSNRDHLLPYSKFMLKFCGASEELFSKCSSLKLNISRSHTHHTVSLLRQLSHYLSLVLFFSSTTHKHQNR